MAFSVRIVLRHVPAEVVPAELLLVLPGVREGRTAGLKGKLALLRVRVKPLALDSREHDAHLRFVDMAVPEAVRSGA